MAHSKHCGYIWATLMDMSHDHRAKLSDIDCTFTAGHI